MKIRPKWLWGVLFLLGVLLAWPRPGYAHAELITSTPGNGDQLSESPPEVTIHYSQGVQIATITVVDSEQNPVHTDVIIDADDWTIVHVPLQPLSDGVFTVQWEALAEDGHTTDGSFFFIVGEAVLDRESFIAFMAEDDGTGQVSPLEAVMRGFYYIGLILLLGVPVTLLAVIRPVLGEAKEEKPRRIIRRLLLGGAIVLAVAPAGMLLSQIYSAFGTFSYLDARDFVLNTPSGRVGSTRILIGLVTTLFIWRTIASRLWYVGGFIAGLIAIILTSTNSHTAAMLPGAPVLSDFGHLIGAGLWAGGLAILALVAPPLVANLPADQQRNAVIRLILRFSFQAVIGVGIAIGTGLLLTSYHVPVIEAMVSTLYGVSLSIKMVIILIALALAGFHRLVLLRRLKQADDVQAKINGFFRSVRVELIFVVEVFFLAGLITASPPAHIALADTAPAGTTLSETVNDVDIQLVISPVRVGLNLFDVYLTQNGEPVPVESVERAVLLIQNTDAEVRLPQVELEPVEPGLFSALTSFTLTGNWRVRFGAQVDGKFTAQPFVLDVYAEGEEPPPDEMDHSQHMMHDSADSTGRTFPEWLALFAWATFGLTFVGLLFELVDYRRVSQHLALLLVVGLLVGCGSDPAGNTPEPTANATTADTTTTNEPIKVIATTTVIADFVEQVAQDRVEITVLLKAGTNHHSYEPTMGDLRLFSDIDIIFSNGVGLEQPWLNDMRESAEATATLEEVSWGAHLLDLDHRDHMHERGDPYVWHNTENAKLMIDNIVLALSLHDPDHADFYTANGEAYKAEIDGLTTELATLFETIPAGNRHLVTSHEAFYYLADQFGFELVGTVIIASHETKVSSARDTEILVERIQTLGIPAIFAGTTLDIRQAETVANEADVELVVGLYGDSLDPAGGDVDSYLKMMRHNAELIVAGLGG